MHVSSLCIGEVNYNVGSLGILKLMLWRRQWAGLMESCCMVDALESRRHTWPESWWGLQLVWIRLCT